MSDRAQRLRRSTAIHAYVGVNGSGKSLAMVHDTLPALNKGRLVYSTVPLYDASTGLAHPLYRPLNNAMDLLDLDHCDILLDEVTGAVNSRLSMGLPVQVQNLLVQLRRKDMVLRWTCPRWGAADVTLRSVTQAVTKCRGYLAQRSEGREWPTRRLFQWVTFDARDVEAAEAKSMTDSRRNKPLCKEWFWRPGKPAERAYQTFEPVFTLEHISEAGVCGNCGGKRTHPRCKCDDASGVHEHDKIVETLTEARRARRLGHA